MKQPLTERQQEVYDMIVYGHSQKDVAKFLHISLPSVNQVVKRLVELGYLLEKSRGVYLKNTARNREKVIHTAALTT